MLKPGTNNATIQPDTVPEEIPYDKRVCDITSQKCKVHSQSAPCSLSTMVSSEGAAPSPANGGPHTPDTRQYIMSSLQRMMAVERNHRSTTEDHRALQDSDNSLHNQVWRERVAQWCYDVLDYLEESRDVASVAMNIIDRYIAVLSKESSPASLTIREFDYEVISFTALFLAIRVSGSNKELEVSELLQLSSSSGVPEARHIVSAGKSMLEKLSWNHQILTPNSFLKELLGLLIIQHNGETQGDEAAMQEAVSKLQDFASYIVEVSVCDIYFSSVAPSEIAFGALALAMTCNPGLFASGCQHQGFFSRFFETVHQETSMDIESPHMHSILTRLLNVYNQSQEAAAQNVGMEAFQLDGSHNNNNNGHSVLPHIIIDEEETTTTTNHDGRSSSNIESKRLCILNRNIHHVNTTTVNRTRSVSPIPQSPR